MLTLKRFKVLADSYGAALQRWPEEVRGEAEALLRASAEAHLILEDARILDEAIDAASAEEDGLLWQPGEQDAALARLRSTVAGRIASSSSRQSSARHAGWALPGGMRWTIPTHFGWMGTAAGSGAVIAIGILIGSMYGPAQPSDNLQAMLQPAPIHILAD